MVYCRRYFVKMWKYRFTNLRYIRPPTVKDRALIFFHVKERDVQNAPGILLTEFCSKVDISPYCRQGTIGGVMPILTD